MIDLQLGKRVIALRERVVAKFDSGDWEEVGLLTGFTGTISGHHRLLRSLYWNDEDYASNVLEVIRMIAEDSMDALSIFERYVEEKYPGEGVYISAKPAENKLTFSPHVFKVESYTPEQDLVAVMMPFTGTFSNVYDNIKGACSDCGFKCLRVDEIWEDSTIIQDIFNLILRANIIIVDFTGKNPNVMYETGIAHTLGKHVIPLTQSINDIPFDIKHHRALSYLPNSEGIREMREKLAQRLKSIASS